MYGVYRDENSLRCTVVDDEGHLAALGVYYDRLVVGARTSTQKAVRSE